MYGKMMVLVLVMVLCLSACSSDREIMSQSADSTVDEEYIFRTNELLEAEEAESENLAGVLQEKASGVMVQIVNGNLLGSGVIFWMDKEQVVIVTAAHVLEGVKAQKGDEVLVRTEELKIKLVDGTVLAQGNGADDGLWNVRLSQTSDIGFIILPTKAIGEESLALCRYVVVDKKAFDELEVDDIILVMGSREEVAGNAYEGRLTEPWIYVEDYGQYMMIGRTYAKPGMSGGGVFDMYGRFIGILSGADEQGNLAIVPLSLVLAEL